MAERIKHLAQRQLRTPRAAAIAGILFALLSGTSWLLIRLALPAETLEPSAWLEQRAKKKVAEVSKKWFRLRDTYGVEVAEGQDDVLILAVTVAVDIMAHPTR